MGKNVICRALLPIVWKRCSGGANSAIPCYWFSTISQASAVMLSSAVSLTSTVVVFGQSGKFVQPPWLHQQVLLSPRRGLHRTTLYINVSGTFLRIMFKNLGWKANTIQTGQHLNGKDKQTEFFIVSQF